MVNLSEDGFDGPEGDTSPATADGESPAGSDNARSVTDTSRGSPEASDLSSMTELSTLMREKEDALRKVRHLEEQLAHHNASSGRMNKGNSTIRTWGKKPVLEGQDRANYAMFMPVVMDLFHGDKLLPPKWYQYNSIPGSMCSRTVSKVVVPFGYSKKDYYERVMVPQIIMKWRNAKTNFHAGVRSWVDREFVCACVYRNVLPIHRCSAYLALHFHLRMPQGGNKRVI